MACCDSVSALSSSPMSAEGSPAPFAGESLSLNMAELSTCSAPPWGRRRGRGFIGAQRPRRPYQHQWWGPSRSGSPSAACAHVGGGRLTVGGDMSSALTLASSGTLPMDRVERRLVVMVGSERLASGWPAAALRLLERSRKWRPRRLDSPWEVQKVPRSWSERQNGGRADLVDRHTWGVGDTRAWRYSSTASGMLCRVAGRTHLQG